jgi:glycosyltransferase involved in cell wall biosynthesis
MWSKIKILYTNWRSRNVAAQSLKGTRQRILVDISELAHRDVKTGIQRVVRSVLKNLLLGEKTFRIEPVYRDGDYYRYARIFTRQFLNLPAATTEDEVVDFHASDIFLGLDLDPLITAGAAKHLADLRKVDGTVCFLLHDLLPITHPEWFPERTYPTYVVWFNRITAVADRIIAVSRVVADDIMVLLESFQPSRDGPLEITWSHNGSDIADSVPTVGIRPADADALARIKGYTMFLTVGTIEPRKCISQLLDAAELLWQESDIIFAIVGKRGWNIDTVVSRIEHHPELGRRLFWFEGISDEALDRVYAAATAVILPSQGEGFGLPLIEAAQHGVPIIARNIPVFREIGGDGVFYFDAVESADLAAAIHEWLKLAADDKIPNSAHIELLSWRQSTEQLVEAIQGRRPYRIWPLGG